jgi:integrase/recombinase XerC
MSAIIHDIQDITPQPEPMDPQDAMGKYIDAADNRHTLRARQQDSRSLSRAGLTYLDLLHSSPVANATVEAWVKHMRADGLSPKTINRRISFARDFLLWSRRMGYCQHGVDVKNVRTHKGKARPGPGSDAVKAIHDMLQGVRGTVRGDRDMAIFGLLYVHALRVSEVTLLEVGDVKGGVVLVRRKGHTDIRQEIALHPEVADWCAAWDRRVAWRKGPWLARIRNRALEQGLTPGGVREILKNWGSDLGITVPVRPHGLRHTHATQVLTALGSAVARCSLGHSSAATMQFYDDEDGRRATQGASAALDAITKGKLT